MAKVRKTFACQNCGTQHAKWMGQCSQCKEWNTLVEEIIEKETKQASWKELAPKSQSLFSIQDIPSQGEKRISTLNKEVDRVLGGGIVNGSVILLGGEPGIGKSTLLLQIALRLNPLTILYVSGEESATQIRLRAERIGIENSDCFICTETQTQKIFQQAKKTQPQLLIVDSIQTLQTQWIDASPGSVSQIRECTAELIRFAKETQIPIILVGHITKEGAIAGPKILEHMVDVVLQFEGERNHLYRILRTQKNRFGSTSELGIFEMQTHGLREIHNPSEILISNKEQALSGHAIAATLEGARPLLIEIQALVSSAVYGTPQRSATGFDTKRLNMLLAVLEKRAGFQLGAKDVFLNITGGIKVDDPATDLAVISAILSSHENTCLPQQACFAGEVGLSGEIRPVNRIEQRISEAEKLGYEAIFISKFAKLEHNQHNINVIRLGTVGELYQKLF